jgi:hypothetical protein
VALTVAIKKLGYSVNPWRIGLVHSDGHFQEISHLCFRTRRDALPVLAALAALPADWSVHPSQWPEALRAQAAAIVEATEGYRDWQEACTRGPQAPGRWER